MPETIPRFEEVQREFAARIRDPAESEPPAGVAPERMRIYRELFFNNVESFLSNGFPVLRTQYAETQWETLVRDFFARHRCQTPLFSGIPEEFLSYLQNEHRTGPADPPFLLELAHYEWVELALSIAKGYAPAADPSFGEAPLERTIYLSELAWPLAYRFPVHRLSAQYQPAEPPSESTCLAVYRGRDDQVRFLELNALTYRLLQRLSESGPQAATYCLQALALESGLSYTEQFREHGCVVLRDLADRALIGCV